MVFLGYIIPEKNQKKLLNDSKITAQNEQQDIINNAISNALKKKQLEQQTSQPDQVLENVQTQPNQSIEDVVRDVLQEINEENIEDINVLDRDIREPPTLLEQNFIDVAISNEEQKIGRELRPYERIAVERQRQPIQQVLQPEPPLPPTPTDVFNALELKPKVDDFVKNPEQMSYNEKKFIDYIDSGRLNDLPEREVKNLLKENFLFSNAENDTYLKKKLVRPKVEGILTGKNKDITTLDVNSYGKYGDIGTAIMTYANIKYKKSGEKDLENAMNRLINDKNNPFNNIVKEYVKNTFVPDRPLWAQADIQYTPASAPETPIVEAVPVIEPVLEEIISVGDKEINIAPFKENLKKFPEEALELNNLYINNTSKPNKPAFSTDEKDKALVLIKKLLEQGVKIHGANSPNAAKTYNNSPLLAVDPISQEIVFLNKDNTYGKPFPVENVKATIKMFLARYVYNDGIDPSGKFGAHFDTLSLIKEPWKIPSTEFKQPLRPAAAPAQALNVEAPAFVPGRGISTNTKTFIDLSNDMLVVKQSSKSKSKVINRPLSPLLKRVVQNLQKTGELDVELYDLLKEPEQDAVNKIITLSKLQTPDRVRENQKDRVFNLRNRYDILLGELQAGNDGSLVKNELSEIVQSLYDIGEIKLSKKNAILSVLNS